MTRQLTLDFAPGMDQTGTFAVIRDDGTVIGDNELAAEYRKDVSEMDFTLPPDDRLLKFVGSPTFVIAHGPEDAHVIAAIQQLEFGDSPGHPFHGNQWGGSQKAEDALTWFIGAGAKDANAILRGGGKLDAETEAKAAEFDKLAVPLTERTTLTRDISTNMPIAVGDVLASPGYSSTTRDPYYAKKDTRLVIDAPVGTPVVDTAALTGLKAENEVVLLRNTPLRVTSVAQEDGRRIVRATVGT